MSVQGFPAKRAVIKSWRVFFLSNDPQKVLPCFILRFVRSALNGPASDKVPVHKLSHLEHRDDLLAVEYRQ